jgi:hypothetical protein
VYNDKAIMYDVYNGKAISVQWWGNQCVLLQHIPL